MADVRWSMFETAPVPSFPNIEHRPSNIESPGGKAANPKLRSRPETETAMAIERTLILVKPDGVQRGLVGKILDRFETRGFKILGLKLMRMTEALAAQHYKDHVTKGFYKGLVSFMTSGPLVAACVEGPKAGEVVRKMMGRTFSTDAEPGSIRGDFGISRGMNLIHGSDSPESAKRELGLFFKPEELFEYTRAADAWVLNDEDRA
jgi:nucleoside-diphosphate kinase